MASRSPRHQRRRKAASPVTDFLEPFRVESCSKPRKEHRMASWRSSLRARPYIERALTDERVRDDSRARSHGPRDLRRAPGAVVVTSVAGCRDRQDIRRSLRDASGSAIRIRPSAGQCRHKGRNTPPAHRSSSGALQPVPAPAPALAAVDIFGEGDEFESRSDSNSK